ncbi:ATP phosphoribosyltransferase [Halopolyspora algeriensis]|uniref:ATP phosphoribosyltransferase n=1 Tax=Halopolyspora algeriensis TaxID=1500506 RepID=A0A368VN41_9ACTN|nr:ATP phosphoribosyltransferase [Halopolyspora algeriensis]RCW40452.1 ATP phosphoribosyltransferase [Halopolyspora algeriensis]TQM53735.1 ATP phosphoribosyltransferase [Halopolyspora algeriensis]
MLRVAVPNKGTLAGAASEMLAEAGYRQRHEQRDLTVLDSANDVEFFFLRPKDISIYVGSGELDLGITGRDLALDSGAPVSERLSLGFGGSTFRYAAPNDRDWTVDALEGKRVATSYPQLVADDLARYGVQAEVIRLDGAVEISIQLGVADAIADVVGSGRTLRQHGLIAFGESICTSEAVVVERAGVDGDRTREQQDQERAKEQLVARLQGVVFAQQYVMLDYNCPRELLDEAMRTTPGLESPTMAPLADERWVAVRAMVSRKDAPAIMDRLVALGAKAILSSDIRACRL